MHEASTPNLGERVNFRQPPDRARLAKVSARQDGRRKIRFRAGSPVAAAGDRSPSALPVRVEDRLIMSDRRDNVWKTQLRDDHPDPRSMRQSFDGADGPRRA